MWYKNYYTWFLTWGLAGCAMTVPVAVRYAITGKTTKRKPHEDFHFFYQRDKLFSPNGNANLYTGLEYVK